MKGSVFADRVQETTTTTGTGDLTLAGATANHVTFNAAIGVGNVACYAIVHRTVSEYEIGIGTLSGSTTLQRTLVLATWNGTTLVTSGASALSLSAGTKDVFVTFPSSLAEVRAVVASDVTAVNTTVLADVTGLAIPVSASATEIWQFELQLLVTSNSSATDLELGWSFPSGVTMFWGPHAMATTLFFDPTTTVGALNGLLIQTATPNYGLTAGVLGGIFLRGWIFGGGTAGNVQLRFAQAGAGSANTTIKKGSMMIARKLVY